ncbi:hypothetical protein F2Q70_00022682 [Brassica cretica]|uniref:Uncharacterized protein n=1 Tax=Brassica cretica TaxID=69181 RepID=A0A8S9GN34_BRACR|nr:hypothetical protein F2Q70_00022682 [Brassica cretica]
MQKDNQDEDQHQDEFQQPDPTKIIWKEMQKLKLGADRSCWTEMNRCLIVLIMEGVEEEATTPSKRLETERTDNGLVVLLKPLPDP